MSPIQGAMIAAAIIQDGTMKAPYVVDSITNDQGEVVYQGKPLAVENVVSPASAEKLRELMTETVTNGTSRKIFRKIIGHKGFEGAEFGGKTGSLHGDEPKGKCDWFVGYGKFNEKEIAVAAITVNVDRWTVKSSYLAQSAMLSYLSK